MNPWPATRSVSVSGYRHDRLTYRHINKVPTSNEQRSTNGVIVEPYSRFRKVFPRRKPKADCYYSKRICDAVSGIDLWLAAL